MDKLIAVVTGGTRGIGLGIEYLLDSSYVTEGALDVSGGTLMV